MNPAATILACAGLAIACAVLALFAVQLIEPQWFLNVTATRNGHTLHCHYIGSHNWSCK